MNPTPPIPDEPITVEADDLLDRRFFAHSWLSIIENAPDNSSFRIGIYGKWGEGKTSLMHLMASELRQHGYATAWIVPWATSSVESFRRELLREISKALGVRSILLGSIWANAERWISALRSQAAESSWRLRIAEAVFGPALQIAPSSLSRRATAQLLGKINDHLRHQKVVVFVDDLDRTDPYLLADVLLILREGLALPNLHFVIGLDPDVCQVALKEANPGWADARRFLEKIIEYPFYVPLISERTMNRFFSHWRDRLKNHLDASAVDQVRHFLIPNPRRVKLFLRFIAGLSEVLRRFHRSELNLPTLYLAQLLRIEFPEHTRALAMDAGALSNIQYDVERVRRIVRRDSGTVEEEDLAEYAYAPEDPIDHRRFMDICRELRGAGTSSYSLREMLLLTDEPPILTRLEVADLFDRLKHSEGTERTKVIDEWLTESASVDRVRGLEALFLGLVEYRGLLLSTAADVDVEHELLDLLKEAESAGEILRHFIVDLDLFVLHNEATIDTWRGLFRHLTSWSHFTAPDYYTAARRQERLLLNLSIKKGSTKLYPKMFEALRDYQSPITRREPPSFLRTLNLGKRRIERAIARELMERFEEPDGVDILWGERGPAVLKIQAFQDRSSFHSFTSRKTLLRLASKASENNVIQKNFLTYWKMLVYGVTNHGSSFPSSGCRELLEDDSFRHAVWIAAVAKPLNLRTVGSLEENRRLLASSLNLPEDDLSEPTWYSDMVRNQLRFHEPTEE